MTYLQFLEVRMVHDSLLDLLVQQVLVHHLLLFVLWDLMVRVDQQDRGILVHRVLPVHRPDPSHQVVLSVLRVQELLSDLWVLENLVLLSRKLL